MVVQFVLPAFFTYPIGGYKIVLEYASRLAARGHDVTVYAPRRRAWDPGRRGQAQRAYRYFRDATKPRHVRLDWFAGIGLTIIPALDPRYFKSGDALVASGHLTAAMVADADPRHGRKFQLVHDYEYWRMATGPDRAAIEAGLTRDLTHLSTSPAVRDMLVQLNGREPVPLPDAIDLDVYACRTDPADPARAYVGFPARSEPYKRTADAIEAATLLHHRHPDLKFWAFGGPKPWPLPDWIEYHQSAPDAQIVQMYNRTAVFLVPSEFEGWGLPGSEAMACGAALVSCDCGGVRAYATHNVNAVLTPPRDPVALAEAATRLLQEAAQRQRLARAGVATMQQFGWHDAVDRLERILAAPAAGVAPPPTV